MARYRIPAQINLVDRLDVSDAKSPLSIHATRSEEWECASNVRVTASKATPAPVAKGNENVLRSLS